MLIAQLSDPHVCAEGTLYQGLVDSNAMFVAAIRHLNSLPTVPDVVILTGDVTEHGTPEEYALSRQMLSAIKQPLITIPGNHDQREQFRRAFADMPYIPEAGPLHFSVSDVGPVRIIGLDVTVPGAHHGTIDERAIERLEAFLADDPHRPTMIMMHQPPFESGIPYLDQYRCFEQQRLADQLSKFDNIECIVCGHVHRYMMRRFSKTVACTAPSTTTSIALRLSSDAQPASFIEPPALLLHNWSPTTGMVTHLSPIGTFPGPFNFF